MVKDAKSKRDLLEKQEKLLKIQMKTIVDPYQKTQKQNELNNIHAQYKAMDKEKTRLQKVEKLLNKQKHLFQKSEKAAGAAGQQGQQGQQGGQWGPPGGQQQNQWGPQGGQQNQCSPQGGQQPNQWGGQ
jgi:hypothetical protein